MSKYQELVKAVDALPTEAVEKAKKEVTRKGYDTTGYQYQFLVNVFNEVVGIGNWGFDYDILKELSGKWGNGKSFHEITTKVTVWLIIEDKKASFSCVGGHKSEMYADALKGAITNGFKKTAAFFGVGKKAYEGTIDDDYRPIPVEETQKSFKQPSEIPSKADTIKEIDDLDLDAEIANRNRVTDDIFAVGEKKGYSQGTVRSDLEKRYNVDIGMITIAHLTEYLVKMKNAPAKK